MAYLVLCAGPEEIKYYEIGTLSTLLKNCIMTTMKQATSRKRNKISAELHYRIECMIP